MEALRLRVKGIDFSRNELLIRDGASKRPFAGSLGA